jgi:hypothetical protein
MDSVLQRVEVILSHAFVLSLFVKLTVYLRAACLGCARLFPKWNARITVAALGVAAAVGAAFLGNSAALVDDLFFAFRIYSILFQALIPLVIWIRGELIVRKQKRQAPVA